MKSQHSKNRRRFLAALLAGTALAGGGGLIVSEEARANETPAPLTVVPPPADTLDAEIQRQFQISGGKYTWHQAYVRAVGILSKKADHPARLEAPVLTDLFTSCAQADYFPEQVPQGAKPLWNDLQTLRKSRTVLGTALNRFASQGSVFYCFEDQPAFAGGTWHRARGVASIGRGGDSADRLLTVAHETIHAMQEANGTIQYDFTWPIQEMQKSVLSFEGAARVGEVLIALELKKRGKPEAWQEMEASFPEGTAAAERAYETAIKNKANHPTAMTAAGRAAFSALSKSQWWLDAYNNFLLSNYIPWVANNQLPFLSGNAYNQDTARRTGFISSKFNYTATVNGFSSDRQRFGDNRLMRQAFDYVEFVRLAANVGQEHPAYQEKLRLLQIDANPYMGIDLNRVLARMDDPNNPVTAQGAMACEAGTCPAWDAAPMGGDLQGHRANFTIHTP